MTKRVAVIGGMNMDIGGRAAGTLQMRDSNPGVVSLRPGGVGRNIAQNLRLLGAEVSLVSAVGDDAFGRELQASCEALGLDLSMTLRRPRERSSTYLYVTDDGGDMLLAVSDMDIVDRITPEALAPLLERLNGFDAVVLDANLSQAALNFLSEKLTVPLYADPVSTAKAEKLLPILPRLRALKPNALEARHLTGEKEALRCAHALLNRGVKRGGHAGSGRGAGPAPSAAEDHGGEHHRRRGRRNRGHGLGGPAGSGPGDHGPLFPDGRRPHLPVPGGELPGLGKASGEIRNSEFGIRNGPVKLFPQQSENTRSSVRLEKFFPQRGKMSRSDR